jgi:hypothetical protein
MVSPVKSGGPEGASVGSGGFSVGSGAFVGTSVGAGASVGITGSSVFVVQLLKTNDVSSRTVKMVRKYFLIVILLLLDITKTIIMCGDFYTTPLRKRIYHELFGQ